MTEHVTRPAVMIGDVVFALVNPAAHHFELYDALAAKGFLPEEPACAETGFLTDAGRFVSLAEAGEIRKAQRVRGSTADLQRGR